MIKHWHDIDLGDKIPEEINAYIEIQKGSSTKYEIDKDHWILKVDRFLHSSVHYPGDYGFIPQTISGDGDAVDIVVYTNRVVLPNTLASVRPVGLMKMIDNGEKDDKVVCVYTKDPVMNGIKDIGDLPEHTVKEIKNFFETYKILENKKVQITAVLGRKEAYKLILEGLKSYKKKFK